jgi:hypothetical protein
VSPKRYIGRVCSKHPELGGERRIYRNECPACAKERTDKWRAANKDRITAHMRKWTASHPETNRAKARAWEKANPEKRRARAKIWRDNNPDKCAEYASKYAKSHKGVVNTNTYRYRAKKLRAQPVWAKQDHIRGMYELCALFRSAGLDLHVDHIVPLQSKYVCGLHVENNLQLLHSTENVVKNNRTWPDMPRSL